MGTSGATPRHGDSGASAVEYALLIAFVAVLVFAGILLLGQALPSLFDIDF